MEKEEMSKEQQEKKPRNRVQRQDSSSLKSCNGNEMGKEAQTLTEESKKTPRESRQALSSKSDKSAMLSYRRKEQVEVHFPVNDRFRTAVELYSYL